MDIKITQFGYELEVVLSKGTVRFFIDPQEFVELAAQGLLVCSDIFLKQAEADVVESLAQGDLLNSVGPHTKVIEG